MTGQNSLWRVTGSNLLCHLASRQQNLARVLQHGRLANGAAGPIIIAGMSISVWLRGLISLGNSLHVGSTPTSAPIRRHMHILVLPGKSHWYWKLVADNGQTVLVSEQYYSKWNARRAARKLSKANSYELREVNDRG
jgi:uncharacterized protein YegP (UPF0339 family)